jgi:hypothetical protein
VVEIVSDISSSEYAIDDTLSRLRNLAQFESMPNRNNIVDGLIDLSIEEVYKKISRDIGAKNMVVSEKRMVPSDIGIKFYISTAHVKDNVPIVIAGIHTIPFEKTYMIMFTMITPLDKTATKDNETITRIFRSFHLLGERPSKE